MIEISDLHAGYGKADVLNNVSLTCEKGKVTTLIGPNGCGKSTLLKTVIGLLPIRKGEILLDGISISEMSENIRAQKTAYLSQGKNIPDITVEKLVLHGRFPYLSYPRRYRKCDHDAALSAMKKMEIEHLADKLLSELSGGLRQKVYIAMALCQGADVIMLDEPATYLDISQQMKINEICRELAREGKTVLTVSHDIISTLKNSDVIAVMNRGEIIKTGTPDEIMECGVIPKVFGIEVLSFTENGTKEYYYRKGCENQ